MNVNSISAIAVLAITLVGCAQQLQQANQTLSQLKPAPIAHAAPVAPVGPQPTTAQTEAMVGHLVNNLSDKNIYEVRKQASQNIGKLLRVMACATDGSPGRYLGDILAPGQSGIMYYGPVIGMQYHPKTQCLSVSRLDNWTMPAKNALDFRAVYASDASGESKSQSYTFVRQPDGAWLLNQLH